MALTQKEEAFIKKLYLEDKKFQDAMDVEALGLSQKDKMIEFKKIYGDDYFDIPGD